MHVRPVWVSSRVFPVSSHLLSRWIGDAKSPLGPNVRVGVPQYTAVSSRAHSRLTLRDDPGIDSGSGTIPTSHGRLVKDRKRGRTPR